MNQEQNYKPQPQQPEFQASIYLKNLTTDKNHSTLLKRKSLIFLNKYSTSPKQDPITSIEPMLGITQKDSFGKKEIKKSYFVRQAELAHDTELLNQQKRDLSKLLDAKCLNDSKDNTDCKRLPIEPYKLFSKKKISATNSSKHSFSMTKCNNPIKAASLGNKTTMRSSKLLNNLKSEFPINQNHSESSKILCERTRSTIDLKLSSNESTGIKILVRESLVED